MNQNGGVTSISTASTTMNPGFGSSTVPAIAACSTSQNVCKNGGYCVLLFGRDTACTCPVGFTGK